MERVKPNEWHSSNGEELPKKEHKVRKFLRGIFVHNIVAKIVCILASAALWVLAVGLA